MNILYVSTLCSNKYFELLFNSANIKPQQQAQKFHRLLSDGIISLCTDTVFLSQPLSNSHYVNSDVEGNKKFTYIKISKNRIFRNVAIISQSALYSLRWNLKLRKKEKYVVIDVLSLSMLLGVLLGNCFFRTKIIGIVTDIPNFMDYRKDQNKFFKRLKGFTYNRFINLAIDNADAYILLTDYMKDELKIERKPYVIIEGLSDIEMRNVENSVECKDNEKVIMYSGALHEIYGIKKLIKAFMSLDDDSARLWLFGEGDTVSYIKEMQQKDNRIKYFGTVKNEDIVKLQLRATLLVNPRPTNEEFTKYSFPSKNMEYMASGTPLVTTNLPGMPEEYQNYVYIFYDESEDGIKNTLKNLLAKNPMELNGKGIEAKNFVLTEKNYLKQADKVFKLIATMVD